MFGFGFQELLIILVIVVLFFGAAKLPQIGSSLGKAIRDFRKSIRDDEAAKPPERERKVQDNDPRGSNDGNDDEKR